MSDNAPTEPLGIPTEPLAMRGQTAPMPLPPEAKSRRHLYVLIGIGGVLLVAVLVLLIAFFVRVDDTVIPTVSPSLSGPPTPSATPSEAITPTPQTTVTQAPPAPAGPTFATFSAPTSAGCGPDDTQQPLTFTWSSTDAERAWVGVQTDNAKDSPYSSELPPVYSYSEINYNCDQESQFYTVTLEDGDGELAHKTVTITK